jgi:hypothetical protein
MCGPGCVNTLACQEETNILRGETLVCEENTPDCRIFVLSGKPLMCQATTLPCQAKTLICQAKVKICQMNQTLVRQSNDVSGRPPQSKSAGEAVPQLQEPSWRGAARAHIAQRTAT